MKRTASIAILFFALCRASFAVMLFDIDAPLDDFKVRAVVGGRLELEPLHAAYSDTIRTRLLPLRFDDIAKAFGPKIGTATNWWAENREAKGGSTYAGPRLDKYPADLVLPMFAPPGTCGGVMMLMLSGLHSNDPTNNKSHTDLYAVGDVGYVEFYSQLDGERVQNAVIYFRTDNEFVSLTENKFVPLKSVSDFPGRLEWEKARFGALQKWIDAKLPKFY